MRVEGFSRLSKVEKIDLIAQKYFVTNKYKATNLKSFWHHDEHTQKLFDEFSENTLTNFFLPFGVAPNIKINEKVYCVPMVIEESSVVAAAAKSAKYWFDRGGFKAEVLGTQKIGHVHLDWTGEMSEISTCFKNNVNVLMEEIAPLQKNMTSRGGGLTSISFKDNSIEEPGLCQIEATFETCDAMGANFINTILEALGKKFHEIVCIKLQGKGLCEVIMSILSNYTPECKVRVSVECPITDLKEDSLGMNPEVFAKKFYKAVRISKIDTYRATTHNKGIFNGVDSVVIASGNDFRAVEACGHTYACRDGKYRGLTNCEIADDVFKFWIDLPLSLGTVGGLTSLHPLAKFSLDLLGKPSAKELMMIAVTIGLAQNFSAIKSLVTSGIQKGHMKMHLMNILNHLEANENERDQARKYFIKKTVSFSTVRDFLAKTRNYQ